jgi:hypothetical protein
MSLMYGLSEQACDVFGQEAAQDLTGDAGDQVELYADDKVLQEEDYVAPETAAEQEEGIALAEDAQVTWTEDHDEEGKEAEVVEEEAAAEAKPPPSKRGRVEREDPQTYFRKEIPSFIIADGGQTTSGKLARNFKKSGYITDDNSRRIFLALVEELLNKDRQLDGTIVYTLRKK